MFIDFHKEKGYPERDGWDPGYGFWSRWSRKSLMFIDFDKEKGYPERDGWDPGIWFWSRGSQKSWIFTDFHKKRDILRGMVGILEYWFGAAEAGNQGFSSIFRRKGIS